LWLGFNPETHKELVRLWNSTTVSQAHGRSSPALISLRQLDARVARFFRSAPRVQAEPKSQPETPSVWTQISAALQALWRALERIWLSILAQIKSTK
jgi:hypothetical protein